MVAQSYRTWKNAEIVPIPKNRDLRKCNNWREISILDMVEKVQPLSLLVKAYIVGKIQMKHGSGIPNLEETCSL